MKIKSQKDFFSGLMFMGVGVAFAWGATTYNVGNGARMGPGYFPLLLGVLLAIIGSVITFKAVTVETQDGDKIGKWAWKPLFSSWLPASRSASCWVVCPASVFRPWGSSWASMR